MEITKAKDATDAFKKKLQELFIEEVLIGVFRKNAQQEALLTEFGDPMNNIPANPFLIPGMNKANPGNAAIMKDGAKNILQGKADLTSVLEAVGDNSVNAVLNEGRKVQAPSLVLNAIDYEIH